MIKAPLDETNISPTTIIDNLTECNVEPQGDKEKGYISGVECLFDYWSNVMHITFATAEELEQARPKIEEEIDSIRENTEYIYIKWHIEDTSVVIRFYWIEEDEENRL